MDQDGLSDDDGGGGNDEYLDGDDGGAEAEEPEEIQKVNALPGKMQNQEDKTPFSEKIKEERQQRPPRPPP